MHKDLYKNIITLSPQDSALSSQRTLVATPFLGGAYYIALSMIFSHMSLYNSKEQLQQAYIGAHPDLHIYKPENGIISIATARKIKEEASLSPHGTHNIILIQDIDTCTIEAANTLLKIIEEPPVHTLFVCTTEQHHELLPTIRSRVTSIFPKPTSSKDMLSLYIMDETNSITAASYEKITGLVNTLFDGQCSYSKKMDTLLPFFSEKDNHTNEKLFFFLASAKLLETLHILYNKDISTKEYQRITEIYSQLNSYKQQRQRHSNKKLSLGALILSTI